MRSKNRTSFLSSMDESQARAQSARWLLALMDCDVPKDDDFFAFAGWVAGGQICGMEKLAALMKDKLTVPSGNSRQATQARQCLKELEHGHPSRLDDVLADIYRENPFLQKKILGVLTNMAKNLATVKFSLKDLPFLRRLEDLFGLNNIEMELCYLAFVLRQYRAADRYLEDALELHRPAKRDLLGYMLGAPGSQVFSLLQGLQRMGVLEDGQSSHRLTDSVELALLSDKDDEVQQLFCQPLDKAKVALEKFHLDSEIVQHAQKLMDLGGSSPIHLLLYGAPGSGKTSFASSLAQALGVKAWKVPCGERDKTGDRRAALTACLRLAASHEKSFVLVDEAERMLDTDGDFRVGSAKAWVNDLLERKNTRIIWITNKVHHLDQAVRRRFSYSIHFEEPGIKQRKTMWASVVERLKAEKWLSLEEQQRLAELYPVPIATMDMAVRQAHAMADKKTFIAAIERILKAQVTLRNDGEEVRTNKRRKGHFNPAGITANVAMTEFLENARKMSDILEGDPGMGTMLFYGPPGTGKTALASHLAKEMSRELLIRRASDLLNPYVGMTEKNIAKAFHEAENNDAILLVDEADSFLCSREVATHSWEQSMTNEFLIALDSFTGMCICTTNFRKELDPAAMRRFSLKVEFTYAGAEQLEILYRTILQPLVQDEPGADLLTTLRKQRHLTPGDFAAVKRRLWLKDEITHEYLLEQLLLEQRLKLDAEAKTVGF